MKKFHLRMTVRNMTQTYLFYFNRCSKWPPSILSQNTALFKIALRTRCKILGVIVRQARTILPFRSSTLAGRVA